VTRVLVVDDHPVVREGLVSVLEDQPGIEVVGSLGSAEQAVAQVGRLRPDIVLLDLELPGMDGVTAIPQLLAGSPATGVIVFTAYDTEERVLGAIRAGARGYLLKGASGQEIAAAIQTVQSGGSHLAPRVASTVLAEIGRPSRPVLSQREQEVLHLVAEGLPSKQIARSLGITERTVKFHVASLMRKLEADNRAQMVAIAAERGLLRPDQRDR
jgi:DNA-binding NarL/FixJ family response regulator